MLHRARRKLRLAGALALAGGSLFAGGGPAVAAAATANVVIKPMITSKWVSSKQPPTQVQCEAAFLAPCYQPSPR